MHQLSTSPKIEQLSPQDLRPYNQNARTHSKRQIRQIAGSIKRFGFVNPVLVSDDNQIIAGHGRVEAAKLLQIETVPILRLSHLSDDERRAYVIADNMLAQNAGWDQDILAIELQALVDLDFDVEVTGFSLAEIDIVLDSSNDTPDASARDALPIGRAGPAVTKFGDYWELGDHRLLCGDAQIASDIQRLVNNKPVDLIFTDPPYNVVINGNVGGLGAVKHREFAFASGEMSSSEFTAFLRLTLGNAASVARDGIIAYVCMDWRHMTELLDAGQTAFTELRNSVYGTKQTLEWGPSIAQNMNWCLYSKLAQRHMLTALVLVIPVAIARTCGIMPVPIL